MPRVREGTQISLCTGIIRALSLPIALTLAAPVAAATYYVDGASPSCTDPASGSSSNPYCTISRAVVDRAAPGVTILVRPAIYREQVTVSAGGAAGNPFAIRTDGPGVVVDGADDFSGVSRWTPLSGDVFRAAGVVWTPVQVFLDGARLAASTEPPAALPPGSFVYVAGEGLYVNVGGGNPGSRQVLVGHRSDGFRLSGKAHVTIDGFTVLHAQERSVDLAGASDDCEITNNRISYSGKHGIAVSACRGVLVQGNVVSYSGDHGIYLSSGSTACTIQDNESFGNARPDTRAANGIKLIESSGNLIQRNRFHDNQDTGLQLNTSSNNNLSIQNLCWNNGDHGIDHLGSTGNRHIGDVAYHNFKDGFSIEGSSTNTALVDCIAVDNGLTTSEYDLKCDSSSSPGLVSNFNIFWNSTSQKVVKHVSISYSKISEFTAATGLDAASLQADPLFIDAASGDFHLSSGSPAIDSADTTVQDWPSTDAQGVPRFDDPLTANTGLGPPIAFADRGALEFVRAPNHAPNGVIDSPSGNARVTAGQSVVFLGTGVDSDGNLPLTYSWSFGGGAPSTTLEDPGSVTFNTAGTWTVTFTVTDSLGLADPAPDSRVVTVDPRAASAIVERRVTASSDDAEDRSGSVRLDSSDLELTYDGVTQKIGIRFNGMTIPRGAVVTAAWIQFKAKESQSEATSLTIQAQAIDSAPTFTTASNSISSRIRTAASVSWFPVSWTAGQSGSGQRTPDLSALVQEVVNRSGWKSGNSLAIIVTGTGHRTAYSYDGSSSSAPLLHVEYR